MAGGVDRATFDSQGIVWGLQILSAKESCGGPARQRSTPESIVKSAGRPILRFSRDLGFSGHRKKSWAASIDRGKKPRALQFWHRSFAGGQFISARPCLSFSTEQDERATDFWRLRRFSKLPFAGGEPEGPNSRRSHRWPTPVGIAGTPADRSGHCSCQCLGGKERGSGKATVTGPLRRSSGDTNRAFGSQRTSRNRIRDDHSRVTINLYMGAMNVRHNSEAA